MTTDTQLAPTDAEIEALGHRMCWRYTPAANQFRGSTHTFNRTTLLNFARAVLAKWGQPVIATKISIPTNTMEQEFQAQYLRGFEAGKKANQPAHGGEPVGEVVWAAGVPNSIREVHLKKWDLPIGTKLYTAPQPIKRKPLTEAQREKIIEAVNWYNFPRDVIDAVERAHGITKLDKHG